ncbi:CrcB-like protein [Bifidobacterium lemurum]|uniref:Fluoride-specific ion channel FluC n=1 Tax=Bifidobacterium lemurum TaxID=1603886 RepID=A0A261FUE7_9BIFI|nr:CrcB family protein [Bifidobacterium lemurum]OZG62812.1 CrcB-like protein [Bifidobacterium lemurum]
MAVGVYAHESAPSPVSEPAAVPASEPQPSTMELSAAHVNPRPTGAAASPTPPQIPLAPIKRVQARFNPLADGMIYLVVFVGGCVGTAMRYGLGLSMPDAASESGFWSAFHPATFLANMLACFIFALLTSYVSQATWIRKRARQLTSRGVGMGMCGGFSTLSAMAVEGLLALQDGHYMGFAFYWAASFVGGLVVSWIGAVLGLRASSRRAARAVAETLAKHQSQSARHAAVSPVGEGQPIDVSAGTVIIHSHRVEVVEQLPVSGPPTGDYGQPLVPPQDEAAVAAAVQDAASAAAFVVPPAYEPDPITAEIPLAGDPTTGEVRG